MVIYMSKKMNIVTTIISTFIFFSFWFGTIYRNESLPKIGMVMSSELSSKQHFNEKREYPTTSGLPAYPRPGMRYDELQKSVEKKSKKSKAKISDSDDSNDKKKSKSKKTKSKKKSKSASKDSLLLNGQSKGVSRGTDTNLDKLSEKSSLEKGFGKFGDSIRSGMKDGSFNDRSLAFSDFKQISGKSSQKKSNLVDKSTDTGSDKKSSKKVKQKSGKRTEKNRNSSISSGDDYSPVRDSGSKIKMKFYKSFSPGIKDLIWQDSKERKTYKYLNPQHGNYYPKIATRPYRKSNECAALFDSAKKAYNKREIVIDPDKFVGLALPFARKLGDILQQYIYLQDSCLMLRILLHLYSGMRTRTQFINIIAAVTQNDILLGRIADRNGILKQVDDLLSYFLQLPKHRVDNKSKQLSAIQLVDFFHLSVFPKDNSYESRIFPSYRKTGEELIEKVQEKLGIEIARDEMMSVLYILLNFMEEERTIRQCSEIISAVISATYSYPLSSSQLDELDNISRIVLSCSESDTLIMNKDQIIEIFGPETNIIEMRQKALKGLPVSTTTRIWKEIGSLDYLGRVISIQFNDCNGLKAWHLNRLCSMMEVMNRRLIKTGTIKDLITIEELCGAHRYKAKHAGTKWSVAIKATLQQRISSIPVKIEKLFSHFLNHEKRKLSPLEGSSKAKRENFYLVPEFPAPTYIETVTPKSPATGIPSREPAKPDPFYGFNSQLNWIQNRFLFLAAFIEELLILFGYFTHVSPVNLFNNLGGLINHNSDLSQTLHSLKLTQAQLSSIVKAFLNYEKKLFTLNNSRSGDIMSFPNFLEAFYEYPLAKYIEGRYFIEVNINFEDELESISSKDFTYMVTAARLSRTFTFQGFINSRLKVHNSEENLNFMTTEEAHKILSNCVDYSKISLVAEMKKILDPHFFPDSLISLLAGEWFDYEDLVLPEFLGVTSLESNVQTIYSQFYLSVLGIDGWELLVDPSITLRNVVNNVSNKLVYSATPILSTAAKINRIKYIFNWIQLYFLYKLFKIPTFTFSEIQVIIDSLPSGINPTLSEIFESIRSNIELKINPAENELLSDALSSYFFYEKYFIVGRSLDLANVFETNQFNIIQGRLNVRSVIWDFIPVVTNNYVSDVFDYNTIHFANTVLAYLSRMFTTQVTDQNLFFQIIKWSIQLDLTDDSIFMASSLRIQDFLGYLKRNSKLSDLKTSFLIPWVDHTHSGYIFRRQLGLPHVTSPGYTPFEVPEDVQEANRRIKEIISQIERLSMEYEALLLEFSEQSIREDFNNEIIEKIKSDIQNLLTELRAISSTAVGAALQFLTDKRLVPATMFQFQESELTSMGIQIDENGDLVFLSTQIESHLAGLYTPSLNLGSLNVDTGEVKLEGFDINLPCYTYMINRMQAFRLWWNSVFYRISYLCSDPLLSTDFQNIYVLLPMFIEIKSSVNADEFAKIISVVSKNYPYPLEMTVFNAIASGFLFDEKRVLNSLNPAPQNLQEAYKDLRMLSKFLEFKFTAPIIKVPKIFTFIPSLETLDHLKQSHNNLGNAKVNLLDFLERITAEYYASPPRNMPTIGIPRLNNLAINFSVDLDHLVFLITAIFGDESHYISAPSIGASAFHLAEYILRHIPFVDNADHEYITSEFQNAHLVFGSPIEQLNHADFSLFTMNYFKWSNLYSYLNSELFAGSLDSLSNLILYSIEYLNHIYKINIELTQEAIHNIAYSFVLGQNLLEIARVNINLSSLSISDIEKNEIFSIFSKAFGFLIDYISKFHNQIENFRMAENLFDIVSSDRLIAKFYLPNVRSEMVNRWCLFASLGYEKIKSLFKHAKNLLFNEYIVTSKNFESREELVNQRYHNQMSDLSVLNSYSYVTKTSLCNLFLSFGFFASKILEIKQNKDKLGYIDSLILSNHDIWSSSCGLNDIRLTDYHSVIISVLKNFSRLNGPPLNMQHLNNLKLLLNFFDQSIKDIILSSSNYNANSPPEVLFSDLSVCILAINKFFHSNVVLLDELKMSNSEQLSFDEKVGLSHIGLNTAAENMVVRIQQKGFIESLFFSFSTADSELVLSSGYQADISKQISREQFLDNPIKDLLPSEDVSLDKISDLISKYPISISFPSLSGKCNGNYCSYIDTGSNVNSEVYKLENSFLDAKKVLNVNRATFFLHWWILIWEKLPFYSNDFFFADLFTNISSLSEIFEEIGLSTVPAIIFKSFHNKIVTLYQGYTNTDHIYLLIDAFLDFESNAVLFTGAKDIEMAYSDYGMINSVHSIKLSIPNIPLPEGFLKGYALSFQSQNNLSQYLFRLISEYFAASPRFYPTILVPSTYFLAENFTLDRKNLIYLLYLWSNLDSEYSIKGFFEAPSIGASYQGLADFLLDHFKLNFPNFDELDNYFSSINFGNFFKFGSPITRVINIKMSHSCNDRSCGPFAFKFSDRKNLLTENLVILLKRCFYLSIQKAGIHQNSDINRFFSLKNVAVAILNAVNVLDAVRIHGFEKQDLQVNSVEFNKFCLVFSTYYSVFFDSILKMYHLPYNVDLKKELTFNDLNNLSGRSINLLDIFLSHMETISILNSQDFQDLVDDLDLQNINVADKYESFYGIVTADQSRGLMTVQITDNKMIHLSISYFNYVYCFILFLINVLIENNSRISGLSFFYYNLLNYENVSIITEIAQEYGLAEALQRFLIQKNQFSNGDLTLEKLRYLHNVYYAHANKIFNGALWSAFSSYKNLKQFILSYLGNSVEYESNYSRVSHEFPKPIFSYYSPKSQSLKEPYVLNSMLNDSFLKEHHVYLNSRVSTITGHLMRFWVPFTYFSNYKLSLSVASDDNLSHLDHGNVYLKRKLKTSYRLNSSIDLNSKFNSILDLGNADISTGFIRNSQHKDLNGLKIAILNRAVTFREWLIHLWGVEKRIYRDPVILLFLDNFSKILDLFKKNDYKEFIQMFSDVFDIFFNILTYKATLVYKIVDSFSSFESNLLLNTRFDSLEAVYASGIPIYLLRTLSKKLFNTADDCEIKKEIYKVEDSVVKANLLDYLTQKLIDYFSKHPRSAITFTLPDVTILLDNYSEFSSYECVIEKWAENRLDLISAPSLGLDPTSIKLFITSTLSSLNIADFKNSQLSYGLLNEFSNSDTQLSYFLFRKYDSIYNDLVAPLENSNSLKSAIEVLTILAANVLDLHGVNYFESKRVKGSGNSDEYIDFSLNLDYELFLKSILLGVSDTFAAKRLFGRIYSIRFSSNNLNKIVFDFLRKFWVVKNCAHNLNYNHLEYININSAVSLSLKKMGIYLTEDETSTLVLNYIFVNYSKNILEKTFIANCLNEYQFYIRPTIFSTMPELGVVSQLDGLIVNSFRNENNLSEVYVPKINLLLFYLNSLNVIINQSNNKLLLGLPASINFVLPGIVQRLSKCKLKTLPGFSCIANELLNCMIELNVEIGNITSEILSQVIESLYNILGQMSYSAYPEFDSLFTNNDPLKNRKSIQNNPTSFNPNRMNELLGNYESMKRIIISRFGSEFVDLRGLSASAATLPEYSSLSVELYPVFDKSFLNDIPAYSRNTVYISPVINYSDYLQNMGYSISSITHFFPMIADVAVIRNDFVESKDGSFSNLSILSANRAAMFYIFTQVSTYPYLKIGTISLLECLRYFSKFQTIDISISLGELSTIFRNTEFHRVFQLLDTFYKIERTLFSIEGNQIPLIEYFDLQKLVTKFDKFGPTPLDLEIPSYNGNIFSFGTFICLFTKRFFKDSVKGLSISTCENIARVFWPTENKRISTYIGILAILEYIPSLRFKSKLVKEFIVLLNWYLYTMIGGAFDFQSQTLETFYKMSFSKPFVCKEVDLPWLVSGEFFDVSFAQFNFLTFISAAWNQFTLEKYKTSSHLTKPDLIGILNSLSRGVSILSTDIFQRKIIEIRKSQPGGTFGSNEIENSVKIFLRESRRYSKMRHQGVIETSFMWPFIECDINNQPFVPGLSFPLILNSDSLEITPRGELF